MKTFSPVLLLTFFIIFIGCKKRDDIPPTLTLNGSDTVFQVLNSTYKDAGATATDDIDGNITSNIYISDKVNEDKIGEYTVTYHVVDEAGNEAYPITRRVFVYNQGYIYSGVYSLIESLLYPGNDNCLYDVFINVDSTVNFGLTFNTFACDFGQPVFVQVTDTVVVMPYQILEDSISSMSLQGSGYINDTLIQISYTAAKGTSTELWNATFKRYK